MKNGMPEGDLGRMLRTSAEAGIWMIPRIECLQLLAVCYVFGGGNEAIVFDERIRESMVFAQRMIGVEGCNHPSPEDTAELQRLVRECLPDGDYHKPVEPAWVLALSAKYKFSLR